MTGDRFVAPLRFGIAFHHLHPAKAGKGGLKNKTFLARPCLHTFSAIKGAMGAR
jgi:hypothetical protein